jgi:hypothetical protein
MLRNPVSGRHATLRTSTTGKQTSWAVFALVLIAGVAALTLLLSRGTTSVSASSERRGELRITKECLANIPYCTITGSNLAEIRDHSKVFYTQGPVNPTLPEANSIGLDSSVVLYVGPGDWAIGHCTLDQTGNFGLCTFSDGIGQLSGFHARVLVSSTDGVNYEWNGTYSFTPVSDRED